jgi:hypothetical protein
VTLGTAGGASRVLSTDGTPRVESAVRGRPVATVALAGVLAIVALYEGYRYPFKINATSTSPTYADTPLWLQAGKYVLLAPLLVVLARRALRVGLAARSVALSAAVFAVWLIASVASHPSSHALRMIAPIVCAVLLLFVKPSARMAAGLFASIAVLNAVADIVQITLYETMGRLPALGYGPGRTNRFGGWWDDPNSAGLVAAGVLAAVVARPDLWRGRLKVVVIASSLFVLAVSLSLSAGVGLAAGLIVAWRGHRIRIAVVSAIVAATAATVYLAPTAWLESKRESAADRLANGTISLPTHHLFNGSAVTSHENTYALLMDVAGIPGLCLFLLLATLLVARLPSWAYAPAAVFALAAVFVPYLSVFPAAPLAALALAVVVGQHEREAAVTIRPPGRAARGTRGLSTSAPRCSRQ